MKFEIDGLTIEKNGKTSDILITLKGNSTFYMSAKNNPYGGLLIFNAKYFENQWKKVVCASEQPVARLENRKQDCKYKEAEKGFAQGKDNPVPIVPVYIDKRNDDFIPTLPNGLTRTNFLLANNVKWLVFDYDEKLDTSDKNLCFLIDKNTLT